MKLLPAFLIFALLTTGVGAGAAEYSVIKVLAHRLDLQGRHALSPSLYERDAYQVFLRKHPDQVSALRFDVQWKARSGVPLTLQVEWRGSKNGAEILTLRNEVSGSGWFSRWTALTLPGESFKKAGDVVAWRARLLRDDEVLAEQSSFLWYPPG